METLSNLPGIIRNGPDWFKGIGTAECPGTKIFSISGRVAHDRIGGSTIRHLLSIPLSIRLLVVWVKAGKLKALHVGGPSGCMVPVELMDIPVTYENPEGERPDHGFRCGVLVMDDQSCVVNTVSYFMEYMHKQSCGKCIPCREGTRRMAEILGSITRKPAVEEEHATLERFKVYDAAGDPG